MQLHRITDFALASGTVLAEAVTAYRTLGRLNAEGTNAVLVLHGYTTGPSMLDAGASVAEGSWHELVGPGKAIDSNRLFIVAPNMLGSCYGSTGPGSIDPATGKAYGASFPSIRLEDIVAVQKRLLDDLGVRRLAAAVGPSFGGYQAWQWAVQYPGFVERMVAAVSAPFHPAGAGNVGIVREQLRSGLVAMRVSTLTRYGVDAELAPRIPDAAARSAEILRMAEDWARGFEPESLVTLMRAAEGFDVRPHFNKIQARVLIANSRTDTVFPPEIADQVAPGLTDAGLRWQAHAIESNKGHFASGADAALWAEALRSFMER
ncbi:alpha/beta fold hydrolase [Pelomonas sp. SE-A7]|uniref:alpha/beta fold hydrolase n=1 Tax=Pelomonas sp. SE-A7 TaxID=3054953 RepID=UPI00259D1612|nr:alpha/beta fold hydrolase [Pelomonas sp. SE-A7]MDM4766311.1 alpha/beta fold hydrolase [Pelomonas sp. SE-A7]